MSSLFAINQEETFNPWQMKKTGQNFKWHFLQIVKKRVLSNNNNFSVFFPLPETK